MSAPHLASDPKVQASQHAFPKESVIHPRGDVSMQTRDVSSTSKGSQESVPGYTSKGDATKEVNLDKSSTREEQLRDLYKLIDGIETAMMVTRASDGSLVSRAMQTRQHHPNCDLWFITNNQSHKLDDLKNDNHVNLSYVKGPEWVSVSGIATVTEDRAKIKELWGPDIHAWFGDLKDGVHDGSENDPRISLILVEPTSVHYQLRDKAKPLAFFQIVKGIATGQPPNLGPQRELEKGDFKAGNSMKV